MSASFDLLGPPAREPLPGRRENGYLVKSFRKACVDAHWHFHPEYELTYIAEGRGVFHAGRSVTPYREGDLFLLGANLPHAYGSHPKERTGAHWTVMHFNPARWGREFWSLPQNEAIRRLLSQSSRGLRFRGEKIQLCRSLLQQLENPSAGAVELAVWLELMGRLAQLKDRSFLNARSEDWRQDTDPRLPRVLAWIDDQVENPELTQAGVAGLIGLSPQSFCRFFRQSVGRPFHRYVNELRIAHACSALSHSDKSIAEISFHAGFNNLANFNRRFKELIGRTPSQYRQSRGYR